MPTSKKIRQRRSDETCYVCYRARLSYMERAGGTGGWGLTNKQAKTIEHMLNIEAVCTCSDQHPCRDKLCAFYVRREELDEKDNIKFREEQENVA